MKERAHAELIKQWADGCEIQYRKDAGSKWVDAPDPAWVADYEYRVKPVEPARVYPCSAATDPEIKRAWSEIRDDPMLDYEEERRALIDFGLRHACDNGQIVTREEFDRAIGDRKVRDRAVAMKVRDAAARLFPSCTQAASSIEMLNLAAIIAEVK